jgi:hypothetical protein
MEINFFLKLYQILSSIKRTINFLSLQNQNLKKEAIIIKKNKRKKTRKNKPSNSN